MNDTGDDMKNLEREVTRITINFTRLKEENKALKSEVENLKKENTNLSKCLSLTNTLIYLPTEAVKEIGKWQGENDELREENDALKIINRGLYRANTNLEKKRANLCDIESTSSKKTIYEKYLRV